tara:strand:+ start:334 stop:456 length:123 start_codon:yes stop_codon:yes gene_type:complete
MNDVDVFKMVLAALFFYDLSLLAIKIITSILIERSNKNAK